MNKILMAMSVMLCSCTMAQTQTNFEKEVVARFPVLKVEDIDSVQKIKPKDTLDMKVYNRYLKNKIDKKPIYILNGKRELEKDYFGLLPEGSRTPVAQYGKDGKPLPDLIFRSKAYPLGRIELQSDYYSLIVKVFSLLSTYYDIHNFTKEGKLMSVVPLYYFENKRGMEEKIGVLHIKSRITKDGKIYWWERYPNRTRERVYLLNKDGFFEVVSEKVQGELEN
jgi:hypothetical protein